MHTIRLRKPWTRGRNDVSVRVEVPDADTATIVPGRTTTYSRNFNKPTGLGSSTRVWLRITSWRGKLTSVTINRTPVVINEQPAQIDITEHLEAHNLLCIELADTEDSLASLDGEIMLEIDEPTGQPTSPG